MSVRGAWRVVRGAWCAVHGAGRTCAVPCSLLLLYTTDLRVAFVFNVGDRIDPWVVDERKLDRLLVVGLAGPSLVRVMGWAGWSQWVR